MAKPLHKRIEALEAEVQALRQMLEEHRDAQRAMARMIAELRRGQNTVSANELQTIVGQIRAKQ